MRPPRLLLLLMAGLFVSVGTGLFDGAVEKLGGRGRAEWPRITNPAALRREATALCRDGGGWRELQPVEYPPTMAAALHPASIKVSGERVYVELVPGSRSKHRYHGYSIWPDSVPREDGGIVREESDGTRGPDSSAATGTVEPR